MSSGYQSLQKYKGSLYGNLNYNGIEYDSEIADNLVIASPGGVSGIQHHYTKGIYSDASSSTDIHAGEGDPYVYGEFENLYQVGQSATRNMSDFVNQPEETFTQNESQLRKENFGPIEFLPPPTTPITPPPNSPSKHNIESVLKVMAIFTVGYMAINYITKGGEEFIAERFYKGVEMSWKEYLTLGGVFTLGVLVLAKVSGMPLVTLEKI